MAKIYILNSAGHDFSAARRFSDEPPILLTEGNVAVFSTDRLKYQLTEQLADFKEEDYLLLTGAPVLSLLAAVIIKEHLKLDQFNILLWSANKRQYIRRTIGCAGVDG